MTTDLFNEINARGAIFSPCRTWRYSLSRVWGSGDSRVAFIGLNPSTADETADDPTIRRCIGFAKDWGYDGLLMLNLFAFRATDPADMRRAADPIGPENDLTICRVADSVNEIIAAWGVNGSYRGRDAVVTGILGQVKCLGKTRSGDPKHPLYLPKNAQRILWP